ncbi:MAG: hypothetical protein AAGA30_11005 [Planctomycetota bacterium]
MTSTNEPDKVYLLCRYALSHALYTSWVDGLEYEVEVVEQSPSDFQPPNDCAIVIGHEHFQWEDINAYRRIMDQGSVPILMLADGILEYRNTWENPTIPKGSMYQPLFAHKIACIGNHSARWIDSWNPPGRTEVVGIPRLDEWTENFRTNKIEPPNHHADDGIRLIVATANTPSFDADQRHAVVSSLLDLRQHLTEIQKQNDNSIYVDWRLTDGLYEDTQIEPPNNPQPLENSLEQADIVIVTPSTIYLESVLMGKPTAILDYTNAPPFVSSAWNISAPSHIAETLADLIARSAHKIDYQNFMLRDQLQCEQSARKSMIELVHQMVKIGNQQRSAHQAIKLPSRLLTSPSQSPATLPSISYRENAKQEFAITRLKAELNQAVHRLGTLPRELADKNQQINQLQAALDESRRRVADVRARLFKLRKILGIGKENQEREDVPQ